MKRYVLEFANEFLKNPLMKEEYKERIRQIENKAIRKLRNPARAKMLKEAMA